MTTLWHQISPLERKLADDLRQLCLEHIRQQNLDAAAVANLLDVHEMTAEALLTRQAWDFRLAIHVAEALEMPVELCRVAETSDIPAGVAATPVSATAGVKSD